MPAERTNLSRKTRPRLRTARFSLIEAALATVIGATGVLAIVSAQQAFHQKNGWAQRRGTAMLLANELRELKLPLRTHDLITGTQNMGVEANESVVNSDDLDDFTGTVTNGFGDGIMLDSQINVLRRKITNLLDWSQQNEVQHA